MENAQHVLYAWSFIRNFNERQCIKKKQHKSTKTHWCEKELLNVISAKLKKLKKIEEEKMVSLPK